MTIPDPDRQRLSLRLQGLVQGVGFRPFVHRLATGLGLRGWVRNGADGVELELEGRAADLRRFLDTLQQQPPPRCRIDGLQQHWSIARGDLPEFRIAEPLPLQPDAAAAALISPDLAICAACLAELADPTSRRHRYPFISCTDCGPRYSVLERLPFERSHTSLAAFPLCRDCRREYTDPGDRRFHAQTISCPACGPRLRWRPTATGGDGERAAGGKGSGNGGGHAHGDGTLSGAAAIAAAAAALRGGRIVALQGIGGFQLLVNPADPAAVAELRRRKGRPDKALALMATPRWLRRHGRLSAAEEGLWWSPAAPIVLLRRPAEASAPSLALGVAPDSPWLGVMRPASGLHQLLLDACGEVLVATSANRSGEPMARDGDADGPLLHQLADGVLSHELPIVNPIDDSVVRVALGEPLVLRLGRGLAPLALPAPSSAAAPAPARLALGAQLKGGIALQLPQAVLLSPDLGDVGSSGGARHLQQTLDRWLGRHALQPGAIACDAHPGYSSRQLADDLARELAVPLLPVQHHHAHLLAVMAEHGLAARELSEPAIGVAWDGAGQGDDGTLWGGEALAVSPAGYRRLAHLRPFPLPGGERALREPRRAALGLLIAAYGDSWRERLPVSGSSAWRRAFAADELAVLERAVARGLNCPRCTSVGRLFDGVAALLGLRQRCSYEAQAAIALEGLAHAALGRGVCPAYRLPLCGEPDAAPAALSPLPPAPWQWDWRPLLDDLLRDVDDPAIPSEAIALAFHRALAGAVAELADRLGPTAHGGRLLLSGGCFQNALLLELSVAELRRRGIAAFWPQRLPCNDAALAVGQLLSGATAPITRSAPWAVRHVSRRTG